MDAERCGSSCDNSSYKIQWKIRPKKGYAIYNIGSSGHIDSLRQQILINMLISTILTDGITATQVDSEDTYKHSHINNIDRQVNVKMCKNKKERNHIRGEGFWSKASFTIEAAAVMPIVLMVLVAMILAGYKVHDIFFSNLSANEAVEIYGHLSEEGSESIDAVTEDENKRLGLLFSGRKYSLTMEEYLDGSSATITGEGESRTYEDGGFEPEKIIRAVTVIEEIVGK